MNHLNRLELTRFRCFVNWQADFKPGLNFVTGENGAGKTSVLEAIHLLVRHRSFRTVAHNELIHWGADNAVLLARFQHENKPAGVLGLQRDSKGFTSRLNGETVKQRSELIEKFPLVTITPASTSLVVAGPGERREYLDQTMFHVEPLFIKTWRAYRTALSHRNALLRSGRFSELSLWDAQLVQFGEQLHQYRKEIVASLRQPINDALTTLNQPWTVNINYRSGWGSAFDDGEFATSLDDAREIDQKRCMTTRGPHRAELKITSENKPVAESLSRGQQRILAIALLVAQTRLIAEKVEKVPLVLIDDLGAELDHANANKVIDLCASFGGQVLVTALDAEPYLLAGRDAAMFHVERS